MKYQSSRAVRSAATAIALTAAAGAVSPAHSADRLVPQQYATIQAAINASNQGDRVVISAGLYREAVVISKSVTIEAAPGSAPSQVVLTGTGVTGPAVRIGTGSYIGGVTLRGVTIDGQGTAEPGQFAGLFATELGESNHLLIERCIFKDLRNSGTDGGAVFLSHSATTIRDCAFFRNQSTVHGAAIYVYDNVSPLVTRCVFIDHTVGTGTFYARIGANLRVQSCVVKNSNALTAHFQTGTVTYQDNLGCQIGTLSNGGYVDGGGNNWTGPCPDCNSNGSVDLFENLFEGADCDGNGQLDSCEIATDPSIDANGDAVIDSCQCMPDVTGNGTVDGVDLAALLSAWGTNGQGQFMTDIDGDGIVSGADLAYVLSGWGPCPE